MHDEKRGVRLRTDDGTRRVLTCRTTAGPDGRFERDRHRGFEGMKGGRGDRRRTDAGSCDRIPGRIAGPATRVDPGHGARAGIRPIKAPCARGTP